MGVSPMSSTGILPVFFRVEGVSPSNRGRDALDTHGRDAHVTRGRDALDTHGQDAHATVPLRAHYEHAEPDDANQALTRAT